MASLPKIPLIDIGQGGADVLADLARPQATALLAGARQRYTGIALRVADEVGRAWLKQCVSPYCQEIEAVAARLGVGALGLNLSFEWCCTGLVGPDPAGPGARLIRVLDWRMRGLGRHVVVARAVAPAGTYYNVTWPGAVGVLTAMAPGRFAAAIHQAPMRRFTFSKAADWARNRMHFWRRTSLPPSHLLRHVFETCPDYAAARQALSRTEIALPAIFLLTGTKPDECCVIERLEDYTVVHDGPGTPANDWRRPEDFGPPHADVPWSPRGHENRGRTAGLAALSGQPLESFGWLKPPVLNADTKLAVSTNAATGGLAALGIEDGRPATQEFVLSQQVRPAQGDAATMKTH